MKTIALVVVLCIVATAVVQTVSKGDPHKIQPILDKLGEIDKANRILPLLLSREQSNKLLLAIEKCRDNVRAQEKKEAERLRALAPEIDRVHKEATEGLVPSSEFLKKINDMFIQFQNERNGVNIANSLILSDAIKEALNDGQLKAMAKVVDQILAEQGQSTEGKNDNEKAIYFALSVLMDDDGYRFLTKLASRR